MTLSDLASLGSFVSGVAVLVSLIYLALQVRQAEKNQRAMINDSYAARITELLSFNAEPANAALLVRVTTGETNFTAEELYRLNMIFRLALINMQATFQQHEAGLLDKRSYETNLVSFREGYLARPAFRALWLGWAPVSSPDFRAAVEAMICEVPLRPPVDWVANFQSGLAQVMASAAAKRHQPGSLLERSDA
ncbi:MAG TPA: hypothetical protein VMU08_08490 [Rhizomicrobium sp.]|nr:hypothetical protein [Rhizomicrobium sp.]